MFWNELDSKLSIQLTMIWTGYLVLSILIALGAKMFLSTTGMIVVSAVILGPLFFLFFYIHERAIKQSDRYIAHLENIVKERGELP